MVDYKIQIFNKTRYIFFRVPKLETILRRDCHIRIEPKSYSILPQKRDSIFGDCEKHAVHSRGYIIWKCEIQERKVKRRNEGMLTSPLTSAVGTLTKTIHTSVLYPPTWGSYKFNLTFHLKVEMVGLAHMTNIDVLCLTSHIIGIRIQPTRFSTSSNKINILSALFSFDILSQVKKFTLFTLSLYNFSLFSKW